MALEHVADAVASHGHNAHARAKRYIHEIADAVAAAGTDPGALQGVTAEMRQHADAHAEAIASDPPEQEPAATEGTGGLHFEAEAATVTGAQHGADTA